MSSNTIDPRPRPHRRVNVSGINFVATKWMLWLVCQVGVTFGCGAGQDSAQQELAPHPEPVAFGMGDPLAADATLTAPPGALSPAAVPTAPPTPAMGVTAALAPTDLASSIAPSSSATLEPGQAVQGGPTDSGSAPTAPSALPGPASPALTTPEPVPAPAAAPMEMAVGSEPIAPTADEDALHSYDHCINGYEPHATDSTLPDSFAEFTENGQTDATVQPEVYTYMRENVWQDVHVVWHAARGCGGIPRGGPLNPCDFPELLPEQNECAGPQDGFEFLAMHRHMIQSLKQLWPSRTEQFEGWDRFPTREDYPELLREYFSGWSEKVLQEAAIADDIENNLELFESEGELGQWFQCGSLNGTLNPSQSANLHFALHFNAYPPNNQTHSVANTSSNLDAYLFWKLHGWIDKIWERYRLAKGLTPDEPKLKDELIAQCREMDTWASLIDPSLAPSEEPVELPDEAGFFHERVRPALEAARCSTCHGQGETAGLRLGYQVSSTEIVERLVNASSAYAEGYQLVVPGDPERSWLYLKASGQSPTSGVTCNGVANCAQSMPPGMEGGVSDEGLAALRQWIEEGAEMPTLL